MHIGFILTKTPAEESFKSFLKFVNLYAGEDKISVYLLGNGVFCARKGHLNQAEIGKLARDSKVYVYLDDLMARGIDKTDLINGIIIFDNYDDLVIALMENLDQILSF
jgi:sulfur relay protein TusB/DsrH